MPQSTNCPKPYCASIMPDNYFGYLFICDDCLRANDLDKRLKDQAQTLKKQAKEQARALMYRAEHLQSLADDRLRLPTYAEWKEANDKGKREWEPSL